MSVKNDLYTAISLFSGIGGLDYGFHREGFVTIMAVDKMEDACRTYSKNFPMTPTYPMDIMDLQPDDLNAEIDLLLGGPPCQGFSLAGKQDSDDPRNQMVWRYLKIIHITKPRVFVMENVPGIMRATDSAGRSVINMLRRKLGKMGYTLSIWKINSAYYGVPQLRNRVFFVGTSDRTVISPPPRTVNRVTTAREALSDLPKPVGWEQDAYYMKEPQSHYQELMRGPDTESAVTHHWYNKPTPSEEQMMPHIPPGGNYMDVPYEKMTGRAQKQWDEGGGRTTTYARLHPERPSYTVNANFQTMNLGSNMHYRDERLITIREGLRLQSFPDDFKLVSSSRQRYYRMVGNAVPPMVSVAIARKIKEYLDGEYDQTHGIKGGF